jgi:hypothetical protein
VWGRGRTPRWKQRYRCFRRCRTRPPQRSIRRLHQDPDGVHHARVHQVLEVLDGPEAEGPGGVVQGRLRPIRQDVGHPPGRVRREADELVFKQQLAKEGRLGFWRWLSLFLGVAGTYRQNDSVDVVYEVAGRRVVAAGLPLAIDD